MEFPWAACAAPVACSPCGRYVLAGGGSNGHDVVIADSTTGVGVEAIEEPQWSVR